jgi:hypothetical protein
MKQKIMICEPLPGKSPRIVKAVTLDVQLDEVDFETYVIYQGVRYPVKGDCFYPFILLMSLEDEALQLRLAGHWRREAATK